jgi:ankyrin repeat protein
MRCTVLEVSRCVWRGRRGVCAGAALTLLVRGQDGLTALMMAARNNATEAVKALCAAGAKDLHSAALLNDAAMLRECLAAGAAVDARVVRHCHALCCLEMVSRKPHSAGEPLTLYPIPDPPCRISIPYHHCYLHDVGG